MTKMNMDEKHKIDKLVVSDINAALENYEAKRVVERVAFEKKLFASPEIKAAVDAYKVAKQKEEQAEKTLNAMGLRVDYNGKVEFMLYGESEDGIARRELAAFEKATQEGKKRIEGLKKLFAIKLFADNAEAQAVFEALEKELAKLGV